jgi:hypothetical protein
LSNQETQIGHREQMALPMRVWQESGGGGHDYFCDYSTQDIMNN